MTNCIRRRLPGGTYFFTTRLAGHNSTLLVDEIDRLGDAMRKTIARYPFKIDAIAVLPAAIHTLWSLPQGDRNFSIRWAMLKSQFSKGLPPPAYRSATQRRRQEKGIWQPRYWEHLIEDTADYETHMQMIHTSPVQAGHCTTPQDWPHSSVHRQRQQLGKRTLAPARQPSPTLTFREEGFAHHP